MRKLAVSFGAKLDLDILVGDQPPPATEAMVVPQDVNLIMGDLEPIEDTTETTQDVLARGVEARPRRAGSLVVGGAPQGAPLLLQAIVYDFEHSPPACADHVFEALVRAFEEAKAR